MARSISFDILANNRAASAAITEVAREVTRLDEMIDRAGGSIEVDADVARARQQLREIDSQIGRLNDRELRVDADVTAAQRQLQVLEAEARRATGDRRLTVQADIAAAQARLRQLEDERISVRLDTAAAMARIAALRAELDRAMRDRDTDVDVDVSTALGRLAQLGAQLRDVQQPVTLSVGFASVMEALAWVQRLGGGLAALGALAVVSGGVAKASFVGIGDALKATGEQATAAGGAVSASASSIRSATRAVEQAQRDLRDAYDGVAAAEREVEQSKRDVVAAERGVDRATRDVIQAIKDLNAADQDIIRAEADLERARRSAMRTLEDYQTRTRGMALSQKDASLAVREAQQRLNEVMSDADATQLERERASLSVEQARQREADLTIEATRLAEDKADVDKKGVEQSDQVVAAQDRLASAHDRQQSAAQGVADAQVALIDAQQRVGDAQQKVADAMKGVEKAHEQVALATQRLSDSQIALKEAMAPSGGATAVDEVAEAMAKLTPEGRAFVLFLRELLDGPLKELQDTAQSNFLPGLQDGIASFMEGIDGAGARIESVATSFGDFFRDIGPSAGRAADAFLRLADLAAETTFEGLAGAVNRALDSFTAWANSQSAADIKQDILDVGNTITGLWDKAVLAFRGIELAWQLITFPAEAFLGPVRAMNDLYEAVRRFADRIPGLKGALPELSDATKTYGSDVDSARTKTDGATTSMQRLDEAARNITQTFLASENANIRYEAAVDRLEASLKRNGQTMATGTEKGRENRQALLDLIAASNDTVSSMERQGSSITEVRAQYDQQRAKLIEVATQLTGSRQKAQEYIDKLLQIPASRTTTITANTSAAMSNLNSVQRAIATINDKTVTITVNQSGFSTFVDGKTTKGMSGGGRVPGSPSEVDTEHYMLAPGEFVVRSSQAKRWGPLLEAINAGRDPSTASGTDLGGAVPAIPTARASSEVGGAPSFVINVQVSNAVVGNNDDIARAVSTAVREGITRGYLPASVLSGSGV